MPDGSTNYSQHLSTAKYYFEAQQADSGAEQQRELERDRPSWDKSLRWVSALVGVMLLTAIGAVTWKHRQSLVKTASGARERSFNPVQIVLWATGAERRISDAVVESQRQAAAQFDEFRPVYLDRNFKPFDTTQLWSPSAQEPGKWGGS
jgi:hypothetical protein